jgi:hypothetical protein
LTILCIYIDTETKIRSGTFPQLLELATTTTTVNRSGTIGPYFGSSFLLGENERRK